MLSQSGRDWDRLYTVHQSLAVDASVSYLFAALMWGGTLHLSDAIVRQMRNGWATTFAKSRSTTSRSRLYLAALLAGAEPEKIMRRACWWEARRLRGLAEQALRLGGGACKVVNHYGPTETTWRADLPGELGGSDAGATLSLGRPCRT